MAYETRNIRNIVLLGHSGSGKTTFAESMLYEAKAITRRGTVAEGTTVSDFTSLEQERGSSLFSTLMHVKWKDSKINIIDTPGLDDFCGEVISSLKVADTGLMLLNAKAGVEVGTEIIWDYIESFHTPCVFVINHLDHEKADFDNTLLQAQSRFGNRVLPIQYPIETGKNFHQIIDALRMVMYDFTDGGGKPKKMPIPESEMARAMEMHNALVEAAAENEEGLMEKFFNEGTLSEEDLAAGLRIAVSNQRIFPVFCDSASQNMGSGRIMGFINDICPSPADRPPAPTVNSGSLASNSGGKRAIFIYKTYSEPRVGSLSYFKVYSGVLKSGDDLINDNNNTSERFGSIYEANGKSRELVDMLKAGDIGVAVKLKDAHTNNTLSTKGYDVQIKPIEFPEPRMRVAVRQSNKQDVEKVARALHTLHEEDPTLIIEHSQELKQLILHGQGQLHLDLVKHRLEKIYDTIVEFEAPKISYRETITKAADEIYRHKKQSGGAGQFAEVHMRVEPFYEGMPPPANLSVKHVEEDVMKWGGKLVFVWCIVGGTVDSRFSSAIKKGVMMKMQEGPLVGSPCRDVRVSIYDGKMHPVDSNDMAFQIAGSNAFRNAFRNAGPQILEPIYDVEVLCSDDVMGDVMSDLQTRRAIITGMDSDGHYQKITARAPLSELDTYSSALRSISQGKAKFHIAFAEYSAVPFDLQNKLMDAHVHEHDE
ncbi:MAG: elongation factor G [Saprospiraceae bacterium]